MKAIRHSLLGILGLCLAGFSPAAAQDSPAPDDYLTISGIVRDIETQQELAYATISVPDNATGTVANKDGEFSFKLKEPVRADEEIEVSYLGYHSVKFKVGEKDDKKRKVILMTPYVNQLSEVVIYARDPLKLVEEAIKKIPENYDPNQSLLTGFYRETAQKRKRFINISEAIVRVSKTPYDESVNRDRVQILKGR